MMGLCGSLVNGCTHGNFWSHSSLVLGQTPKYHFITSVVEQCTSHRKYISNVTVFCLKDTCIWSLRVIGGYRETLADFVKSWGIEIIHEWNISNHEIYDFCLYVSVQLTNYLQTCSVSLCKSLLQLCLGSVCYVSHVLL